MKRTGILPAMLLGLTLLQAEFVQAAGGQTDWQLAYQKVLTTYSRMQGFEGGSSKEDYGSRWDLYDIDGDGSPELFVSPDSSHLYGVMIYTCIDGSPRLLQCGTQQAFGESGLTAVNAEEHLLGSFRSGTGIMFRTIYRLEKGTLTEVASFMTDIDSYPDSQKNKAVWQVNGVSVSQADYEADYAPYANLVWREDVGRTYAFSDRSPLAADSKRPVAAAPPDMKTALITGSIAALVLAAAAAITSLLMRRDPRRHR